MLAVKLETTHKPAKVSTNHPKTSQTTHKPAKYRTNHPKTSQLWAENHYFMLPKTLATMQNMSYICNHFTQFHKRLVAKIKTK